MPRLNLSLLRLAEALINKAVYKVPRNQSPPLYRLVSRVFKTRGSNAQNLQSCDFAVWWSDCVAVLEPLIDSYEFRRAQREDEGLKVSIRHNPWWQTLLHQCRVCSNQSPLCQSCLPTAGSIRHHYGASPECLYQMHMFATLYLWLSVRLKCSSVREQSCNILHVS